LVEQQVSAEPAVGVLAMGSGTAVARLLDEPGPGLGESTLVVANMVDVTRYAPSLVLLVAALVARRSLPKPVTIAAGVILAMVLFPITTWIAVILTPIWLGVAGAVSGSSPRGSSDAAAEARR